ncbi:MAG TPA: DUF4912 domain-containing protein [Polyangia bacterium]
MSPPSAETVEIAKQILGLIGQQDPLSPGGVEDVGRALRSCSRDQLLGFARQLGVSGVTKLAKDALAGRVAAALDAAQGSRATASASSRGGDPGADPTGEAPTGSLAAKFDLGPEVVESQPPRTIPWGYGGDRVTAMAVDPRHLYAYWEVTDDAIEAARKQLGGGGPGAWLNLRVYDITGRLFDGTNAHSYFDEGVGRDVRQWFFDVGKPSSTACVEIGLKSSEGYFVRIMRSGRVDFAREAPAPAERIEWLTVRTATGQVGEPVAGGPPRPDGHGGGGAWRGWRDWRDWTDGAGFPVPGGAPAGEAGVEWREVSDAGAHLEVGRIEWIGPVFRTEWQAGPFEYPMDVPSMVERHETGEVSMRSEDGVVHVVYGPWQVVIRGLGARAERRVLATWEYRRTVEMPGGFERDPAVTGVWEPVGPGSSAWRLVGASERRWMGASELLYRGGSEVWMLGASESLYRGASERLYRGASERLYRGASERRLGGASERRLGGASERLVAGRLGAAGEDTSGGGGPVPPAGDSAYPWPET